MQNLRKLTAVEIPLSVVEIYDPLFENMTDEEIIKDIESMPSAINWLNFGYEIFGYWTLGRTLILIRK